MIRRKGFHFRLVSTSLQRKKFAQNAGCNRFVWNKMLALQKEAFEQNEKIGRYVQMTSVLPDWKEEFSWLKEAHSQCLQQILKDLDRAWGDFFLKKKGMPCFKKKGMHDSFRYPQGCKFKGHKLFVPKIGWIKFRKSRSIEGVVKNVTVSRRAGEWYVSVQTEEEVETPIHPHETIELGIDMGVARLATLSNGLVLEPCRAYRSSQRLLGKAQADLSRKKRRSNNRRKQILRLQRLHKRAADIRRDYLHKATTWIAKNHGKVMLEDLQVAKMSARGTVENPGSSVSVKARLNQGILDQGWHEFRRQLSYKLEWLG